MSTVSDTRSSQARERNSEKDASSRISAAEQSVVDAQRDAAARISSIRDEYERRSEKESDLTKNSIETEKRKGYEKVLETQRQQQAEINRIRRDGERDTQTLQEHYKGTVFNAQRDGEKELQELKLRQSHEMAFESSNAEQSVDSMRKANLNRGQDLKEHQDGQIEVLKQSYEKQFSDLKLNSDQSQNQASEHFQTQFQTMVDQYGKILNDTNSKASQQLKALREDTSRKLSAYGDRQSDPFYQLIRIPVSVSESNEAFTFRAQIPAHEQKNLSISIRGSELVISGQRKNEERLDVEPGHTVSTSSYQNYSESFPLNWPVQAKGVSREFTDSEVIIRIPKQQTYSYEPFKKKPAPDRIKAEHPVFPENIPLAPLPPKREV